jgi:hypothetical protein
MNDYVDSLELSVRAERAVRALNVTGPSGFLSLTRRDVLKVPNSGMKTWHEIAAIQRAMHLKSRGSDDWWRLVSALQLVNTIVANNQDFFLAIGRGGNIIPMTRGETFDEP